ncbi:MAG: 3'-5' exonuclease [Treponemataceae bacterium]
MSSYKWLSAVYDKATFVSFDTETTGLDAEKDRVVEIGAIKFDKRGVIARMSVLINPEMPMPEGASAVNNITDELLQDKPLMKDVIGDFLAFIEDSILVIHNAKFDIGMMNSELKRLGGSELTNKIVDTWVFAKEVYPGLESYSLQKLAALLDLKVLDAHRAEDDARVCMDFFNCAIDRFFDENADMLESYAQGVNIDEYLTSKSPTFRKIVEEPSLF